MWTGQADRSWTAARTEDRIFARALERGLSVRVICPTPWTGRTEAPRGIAALGGALIRTVTEPRRRLDERGDPARVLDDHPEVRGSLDDLDLGVRAPGRTEWTAATARSALSALRAPMITRAPCWAKACAARAPRRRSRISHFHKAQ